MLSLEIFKLYFYGTHLESFYQFTFTCVEMSELLFECYHVPSVAYGIDSLFSYYNNHHSPRKSQFHPPGWSEITEITTVQ